MGAFSLIVVINLLNSLLMANRSNVLDIDDVNVGYETSEGIKVIRAFEEMKLKSDLLRGIYAYGFEKPSAIQQRAITPILQGRDVIAQSQSGTGKTTIFCIGILQCLNTRSNDTQALALSPTREL